MEIQYASANRTVVFAATELQKYLSAMGNQPIRVLFDQTQTLTKDVIRVGTFEDLGLDHSSYTTNHPFDDHVFVDICKGEGVIAGSNERSVLLSVYAFLTRAGLRWVRPGREGEVIVQKKAHDISVTINQEPDYRHRGVCIEGANSIDNVLDMIDWLPKVGMNSYFIQFREAFTFFDRWYGHHKNETRVAKNLTIQDARNFVTRMEDEIDRRGLIYHAVGHGWTCEPFGIPGLEWDKMDADQVPQDSFQYFAKLKGKRDLWGGIPLNTNLCYSNKKVQNTIAESIVEYCKEHPRVDMLHFWLADGSNNHCECEDCIDTRPSDFYVDILNEIDQRMTKENLQTKLVFLIYVDLLWPPEKSRLINSERFVLMFAPITRTYAASFETEEEKPELSPYKRNKLIMPKSVEENLSYLDAWQKLCNVDSFDFDYHMMWDHYLDPGYHFNAYILHQDIKNLKNIGLNGLISCQVQRAFCPTGLPMYVMAKALFNTGQSFADISSEYFDAAFGVALGSHVEEYIKMLSIRFNPFYMRDEPQADLEEAQQKFGHVRGIVDGFMKLIDYGIQKTDLPASMSFEYLKNFLPGTVYFADCMLALANGDEPSAKQAYEKMIDWYKQKEPMLQPVFDVYEFITTLQRKIRL